MVFARRSVSATTDILARRMVKSAEMTLQFPSFGEARRAAIDGTRHFVALRMRHLARSAKPVMFANLFDLLEFTLRAKPC